MKRVAIIVLAIMLTLLGVQVYSLNSKRASLKGGLSKINGQIEMLEQENENLKSDLAYFSDTQNLIKELKSKFNYKRPGEKLIIVAPKEWNAIIFL